MKERFAHAGPETVCVGEADGKVVGFCCGQIIRSLCYDAPYAEITELFVMEPYRKLGMGKILLKGMESLLAARGVQNFLLYTNPRNAAAHSLYKRCVTGIKRSMPLQRKHKGAAFPWAGFWAPAPPGAAPRRKEPF